MSSLKMLPLHSRRSGIQRPFRVRQGVSIRRGALLQSKLYKWRWLRILKPLLHIHPPSPRVFETESRRLRRFMWLVCIRNA